MPRRHVTKAAVLTGLCLVLTAGAASAAIINLSHGNSAVNIDDQAGAMWPWVVDGTSQLNWQSFAYRVGPSAPNSDVDTLNLNLSSSSTFLGSRGAELVYADLSGDFTITITYLLTGGSAGSNQSLLAQEISILNTSGGNLDFHFFQYADFDLNGTLNGDTVQLMNANTMRQWEGSMVMEETVATPPADHFAADYYSNVWTSIHNDDFLPDTAGPYAGDAAWAFQWDTVLADGDSLLISKNLRISVVPVPAAVWLFGSALGLLGWARRKAT